MQEEQDTCRICSAPAEPDQPLFYPCKCSGTIRYIHQDCLTTWLAHSKKKTCDVCKHPYSFTKVYSPNMPSRLPAVLLLRRFIQQLGLAALFALRFVFVALIWLAFLPWATIWTWRMYFSMGDSTAWWISGRSKPLLGLQSENTTISRPNITVPANNTTSLFASHPILLSISSDIVQGQIIATVIVIIFVAVFLLREWISQNARPGVFEEGDDILNNPQPEQPPPALPPAPVALPPIPAPRRPIAEPLHIIPEPIVPEEPMLDDQEIRERSQVHMRYQSARQDSESSDEDGDGTGKALAYNIEDYAASGKGKGVDVMHTGTDLGPSATLRRRHRSIGEHYARPRSASLPLDLNPRDMPFTSNAGSLQVDEPTPDHSQLPADFKMNFSEWNPLGRSTMQTQLTSPEDSGEQSQESSTQATQARRPPLPSASLGDSQSRTQTPLASPSLASYRAPEELEAGSSNLGGYFYAQNPQAIQEDVERIREEQEHYFREGEPLEEVHGEPTIATESPEIAIPNLEPWSDGDLDDEEEEPPVDPDVEVMVQFEAPDGQLAAGGAVNRGQEPVMPVPPQEQDIVDLNDDLDAGMEDDMDGALEAIGLRGPIHGVLQNAALMIFVLDTTIGIGVWIPFTVGKTIALLSLDPRRFFYILHFPIRAIRLITDPVVDAIMYTCVRFFLPPLLQTGHFLLGLVLQVLYIAVGKSGTDNVIELSTKLLNKIMETFGHSFFNNTMSTPVDVPLSSAPSTLDCIFAPNSEVMQFIEPYFAPIGSTVRSLSKEFREGWVHLALGNGPNEKTFAICLGYLVDAIVLALYLNVLSVGTMRSAGRAVRSAVRQQLLVVKVAAFIIVELVVFPLGCGVMLDICTVSLFPEGSFRSRAAFVMFAPLTSIFYHWVIGTMFMYQFAVMLAGFRACLRTGALWFIKDPQDQNFHPIRDILERPTLVHIRKLMLSAMMYGLVVACGVGTISGLLRIFSGTIMPFRWKVREPLSEVPVDLLFLHLVLPYTMQYFRPKKFLRQTGLVIWKFLANKLRLTSYLFGGRHSEEEYSFKKWTIRMLLQQGISDGDKIKDGTFLRVPNTDNVAIIRDQRTTVEVTEQGDPINEEEARLMRLQNAEAEKAKRNIRDDYVVVYIPPYFRYRVMLFIAGIWLVGSVVLAGFLGIPILMGRLFFQLFTSHHVHDGYSFIAGFYLLWACYIFAVAVDRMDKYRQRRSGSEPRPNLSLYFAKRSLLWIAQISYLGLLLGVIVPTLIAVVVELYIIFPIRQTAYPDAELRIRAVDMWALGLLYSKIALRAQRLQPMGQIGHGLDRIRRSGFTHPDPFRATKEVIAPLIAGLLGMIILPPALFWVLQQAFPSYLNGSHLFLRLYPSIFTTASCIHGTYILSNVAKAWSQTIRDKEFLVEMRLQNLEPEPEKKRDAETEEAGDVTPGDEVED